MLSSEEFGLYSFAISFSSFLAVFSGLGITSSILFKIPKLYSKKEITKARQWIGGSLKLLLLSSTILTLIVVLFSEPLSRFIFHKAISHIIVLSALFMFTLVILSFLTALFVTFRDVPSLTFRSLIKEGLRFFGIILLVSLGFKVTGAIVGYIIATAIGLLLYFSLALKKKYIFLESGNITLKEIFQYSKWFLFFGIFSTILNNIDIIMISSLLPIRFVGYYRIAYAVINAFISVIPIAVVSAPFLAFSTDELVLKRRTKSLFKYTVISTSLLAILIAISSHFLLGLIYPKEYQIFSSPVLSILAFLIPGKYAFSILSQRLVIKEKFNLYFFLVLISALINIITNYYAIKAIGISGAAIASVFSLLVAIILCLIVNKKI